MAPSTRRLVRRALLSVAGLAAALTAVVGFAHTKPGRPLLAWMGGKPKAGVCPLGYGAAQTPEQKEGARRRFAALHAGEALAAARPAIGFALEATTRDEVAAWAKAHGATCEAPRSGPDLDCTGVPDAAVPAPFRGTPIADVWLTFGPKDTLATVIVVRSSPDLRAVSATFDAITAALTEQAGPPATLKGDPAARLAEGPLQQASAEYRFRDYYSVVRATSMGEGFVLTEEYRALPR